MLEQPVALVTGGGRVFSAAHGSRLLIAVGCGLFAAAVAYAYACERL